MSKYQSTPKSISIENSQNAGRKRPLTMTECFERRTRTKSRKSAEESTCQEGKTSVTEVYNGNECPSCAALDSIKARNMARLQHHYKHCACYSIYYRFIDFLKTTVKEVPTEGELQTDSRFLNHNEAKEWCLTESNHKIYRGHSLLFQEAAKLSDQLLGPAETATFDCDCYEKYLRLLLDIAEKMIHPNRKENRKIVNDVKILKDDIKNYLKPFNENTNDERINTNNNEGINARESQWQLFKVKKWNETFIELGHSPVDEVFGKDLKEIVEPKRGETCFFFPEHYQFKCHGQMSTILETNDELMMSTFFSMNPNQCYF